MKNIIIRYGIYGSILLILTGLINWFFVAKPLGYTASEVVGYLSMFIALSTVYFGVRYYRENECDGIISFGQAFKVGMGISLVPSIVMFFYTILFFKVWGADFKNWAEDHFQTNLTPEAYLEYQKQVEAMGPLMENLAFQGGLMFATVLIIGVIVTLVVAFVLQNKRKEGSLA